MGNGENLEKEIRRNGSDGEKVKMERQERVKKAFELK